MSQLHGNGFSAQPVRGSCRLLLPVGFAVLAVFFLLTISGVAQTEANNDSIRRSKSPVSYSGAATLQEIAPQPVVAAPRPTVEPTRPPSVVWDGKQLTIDAENATLADILAALKTQTGASIEIPAAAWRERVFVHLGPGPLRDIISSLVYGLPFDYIVETAEDDPDTLRSVVLTPQGQGDSSDSMVAGITNAGGTGGGSSFPTADSYRGGGMDGSSRPEGARMMRGWSSSGKTTFQAEAEAALAAKQAAASDSAPDQDGAAPQDSASTQDAVAPKDSAVAQDSTVATDVAENANASNSTSSAQDSDDHSGVGQAIQNMNRMFEQRRQIQAEQNHPAQPASN